VSHGQEAGTLRADSPYPADGRPLALSLGDPAGVGPEIIAKAWTTLRETGPAFVVVGDHDIMCAAMPVRRDGAVRRVSSPAEARQVFGHALPVIDSPLTAPVVSGKPSPAHAAAVIRWIETAVGLALSGAVSGLVTAPIAKAPLYAAGFGFPGHTEFLAELTRGAAWTGPRGPVMMLTAGDLRAALVTIHQPLREAIAALTTEAVVHVGQVTADALTRDFGVAAPRLALAGLNPHAGEGGALGREEIEILNPAAARLRALGIDCSDARPADSLFHAEARTGYDAALCLYHDQALIPVKTIDFWGGVNVTLGLPIIRTSPDHGVGYDIAGRGLARPESLIAAIRLAAEMAARRGA
jgi:4-hydroxythreonine-4-phosphate dehydrogenase